MIAGSKICPTAHRVTEGIPMAGKRSVQRGALARIDFRLAAVSIISRKGL